MFKSHKLLTSGTNTKSSNIVRPLIVNGRTFRPTIIAPVTFRGRLIDSKTSLWQAWDNRSRDMRQIDLVARGAGTDPRFRPTEEMPAFRTHQRALTSVKGSQGISEGLAFSWNYGVARRFATKFMDSRGSGSVVIANVLGFPTDTVFKTDGPPQGTFIDSNKDDFSFVDLEDEVMTSRCVPVEAILAEQPYQFGIPMPGLQINALFLDWYLMDKATKVLWVEYIDNLHGGIWDALKGELTGGPTLQAVINEIRPALHEAYSQSPLVKAVGKAALLSGDAQRQAFDEIAEEVERSRLGLSESEGIKPT